jgi:hypothetical protein
MNVEMETSRQGESEVYDSNIRSEQYVANCLRIPHIDRIAIHSVY